MQIRHFRWAAGVKFYFKIRNFPEHRILVLGTPICKAVINFKNFCQMKHPKLPYDKLVGSTTLPVTNGTTVHKNLWKADRKK